MHPQLTVEQQIEVVVRLARREQGVAGADRANVAAAQDRSELVRRDAEEQRLIGERRIEGVTGHQQPSASPAALGISRKEGASALACLLFSTMVE